MTTDKAWLGHVQWHIATVAVSMMGQGGFSREAAENGARRALSKIKFEIIGSMV